MSQATMTAPRPALIGTRPGMAALVRSEYRKLFGTKLWLWLWLGALGFTTLATVFTILPEGSQNTDVPSLQTDAGLHNLFAAAGAGSIFAVVLGAIGMTAEFRHLTATPTFLATPHRGRVVIAKLITYATTGLVYGVTCVALVLAIALPWLPAKEADVSLTSHGIPAVLIAAVAIVGIYALLGVGIGALIRNQIAAVVGTLIYLFVLEGLISNIPGIRDYYKWFPGGAAAALGQQFSQRANLLEPWQGGLVLVGYGLAFAIAGTFLAVRRDVS
jgi:ABC-2 type transport system permease protein